MKCRFGMGNDWNVKKWEGKKRTKEVGRMLVGVEIKEVGAKQTRRRRRRD